MEISLYRAGLFKRSDSLDLYPRDYLDCETEEDLRMCIEDDIMDSSTLDYHSGSDDNNFMDLEPDVYNLEIPDKFIAEWKILKANGQD